MTRFGLSVRGRARARFEAELKLQGRAMATTQSHSTTAELRTHNLPVPSECAACYATDAGDR